MTERPSLRRHFSWASAATLVGLALIGATVFLLDRCASFPLRTAHGTIDEIERAGRDARKAIVQIAQLQPRVTINDRVYYEQTTPVAELAFLQQRVEVEHEFMHTWAGSTKKLRLHGTYNVKVGFDLRQDFSVNVSPEEMVVRMPHARILGLEQLSVEVLAFENGLWNPISGADVQEQLSQLETLARERANAQELPAYAERMFRVQLLARVPGPPPAHVIFYAPNERH
ncbi:MAG: DUF4230 domain-containing protein [Verrucomicrobiota bacterium]|nr:DUF4230 domain-containing protein [Verrucomicrobiota bacterium]